MSYNIPKNLLDINSSNSLLLEDGSRANPAISFASQTDMGLRRDAVNQLALISGSSRGMVVGNTYAMIGLSSYFAWRSADSIGSGVGNETRLRRDDKGILGITTYDDTSTGLNLYNTYTDASNYERLELKWDANVATIATTSAGTGSARSLYLDGENQLRMLAGGNLTWANTGTQAIFYGDAIRPNPTDVELGVSANRWLNTYTQVITIGDGVDAVLTADADDELALRSGTNAQSFSVYNTYTDASNYERLEIEANTGGAYNIKSDSAGTGSNRPINLDSNQVNLKYNGGNRMRVGSSSTLTYVPMTPDSDGSASCGTNGVRWSNTYTDSITIGDGVDAVLTADADNVLALKNSTNAPSSVL